MLIGGKIIMGIDEGTTINHGRVETLHMYPNDKASDHIKSNSLWNAIRESNDICIYAGIRSVSIARSGTGISDTGTKKCPVFSLL
jgi:hypothetical protein